MTERAGALPKDVDPNDTPFALPPGAEFPFDKDSEEARAIREVIEESDRERAERSR